ncbi:MAG: hypothetical protein K6A05_04885 [Lachnospiraceae bacterium]|nr:hypothetical protein [Lachnospiraceae bacterium]
MNKIVKNSMELSPRQKVAYDFIVKYMEENGFCPTTMEIQKHMHYASTACVCAILRELEYKGKIELPIKGAPRAIRVIGMKFVKDVGR